MPMVPLQTLLAISAWASWAGSDLKLVMSPKQTNAFHSSASYMTGSLGQQDRVRIEVAGII